MTETAPVKVTAEQLGVHVRCVYKPASRLWLGRKVSQNKLYRNTCINSNVCIRSEQFAGQLDFDLGNLVACDPSPVDAEEILADPDTACLEAATKVTQALVAQLFALPSEAADVGRVAQLPPPTTALPRAKALPKPREPTKWEKFAAQKGINQKRKRSREVWDEESKEYKRRHGYGSVKDDAPAVIEARASDKVCKLCCAALLQLEIAYTACGIHK